MDWTPTLLRHFDSLGYAPPQRTFTILAAFFLVNELDNDFKIVSMSTGTKCLPTKNYSKSGDVVHDFHAEVLARRGAVRWLLTEMARGSGRWLTREHTYWTLRQGVTMNMYISELPCGEASTRATACLQLHRDPKMASLKSLNPSDRGTSTSAPTLAKAARGRDGYDLLNHVRTKPGRSDSPPTNAMSCSDKIAMWSVVGIQGALTTSLGLKPVHLAQIIIGNVAGYEDLYGDCETIQEDCHRAFSGRLARFSLEGDYRLHPPRVAFTNHHFKYSRNVRASDLLVTSNESLCWIADEPGKEVLVNGNRRGTLPKNRSLPGLRPRVAKASLFAQYQLTASAISNSRQTTFTTDASAASTRYYDAKHSEGTEAYHLAKAILRDEGGPLLGWVICDTIYETFCMDENTNDRKI